MTRLVAESREAKQNNRDLAVFSHLRANGTVGSALRVFHQPGPLEPALWIADCVAGAASAALSGKAAYLSALQDTAEVIHIAADSG